MKEHQREETRRELRHDLTSAGALGLASRLLAGTVLVVGALTILAGCVECFGGSQTVYRDRDADKIVLDVEHPIAEQQVTLHINAGALPTAGKTEATLIVQADPDVRPNPASTSESEVVPEFTLIRDDNEVMPIMIPAGGTSVGYSGHAAMVIPLDCPMGADCDRTYRLRVAAPGMSAGQSLSAAWQVAVQITYTGVKGTCGTPNDAKVTVEATSPEAVPADRTAFADVVERQETVEPLVARHVTITSDAPPTGASLRLSQTLATDTERSSWTSWVRVIPDGSATPAASALLGRPTVQAPDGWIVDAPVLGDCPATGSCERGYWVVFQGWPDAGGPSSAAQSTAQMTWTVAATATYPDGAQSAPGLRLTVDDLPDGLAPEVTLEQAADELPLKSNEITTAIDAVFTIPARPAITNGLGPLTASFVVVDLTGRADGLAPRLEGDGAENMTGFFRGDGAASLVAHPFDRCPATGPCTVTVRLVGAFRPDANGWSSGSRLLWSVSVWGAPPGTTVTFGSPYEIAGSTGP